MYNDFVSKVLASYAQRNRKSLSKSEMRVFCPMRVASGNIIIRYLGRFVKIISLMWGDYLKSLGECQRTRSLSSL
jgi:hypothetical protein